MSTSTQFTDFSDLYTGLLNRVRESTTSSVVVTKAKQFINTAHADIYINSGEKFPWAERRATLTTHAKYETGTVSITKGSATVTGSSTLWTTTNDLGQANARAGGKMTLAGSLAVYPVQSVDSATEITLEDSCIETTDSGASYVYFEDEYALASDFAKPIDYRTFDDHHRIRIVGRQDFRRMFPRNRTPTGNIRVCTLLDLPFSGDTTPVRKIQFAPPPQDFEIIPYTYVTKNIAVSSAGSEQEGLSADSDEPIMPKRYRHLILLHALYNWYRDMKDDSRAQEARNEYGNLLGRVLGDVEIGQQRARFRPSLGTYRAQARRPYRRGSQQYNLYGRFERFEDF